MATRLKALTQIPWTGGIVTSQDESLIGPDNLTIADNMFYTTQGTRIQREGINFNWDDLSIVPVSRASSGTTRTIITTTNHQFKVGDTIAVTSLVQPLYNTTSATVTAVSTTSTTGDTFSYTATGSLTETTVADVVISLSLKTPIIAIHDYWYGATSSKTHYVMAFTAAGQLIRYDADDGDRTYIVDAGTSYTIPAGGLTRASMCTFENRLIVCTEGANNVTKHYFPTDLSGSGELDDIDNTASYAATPKASFCREHLGRLWLNDKANPDRLHYSAPGTYNVWQGAGDSGAIDCGVGDGDPEGITAIFPTFKGTLFASKRSKLYRISGQYPENFFPEKISDSIGCVGHAAVAAIDQDDIIYVSDKGLHSLNATQQYGSFNSVYFSKDIQPTINNEWQRSRQKFIQLAYIQQDNTLAIGVAEEADTNQNQVYMYNLNEKKWFRWPNVSCASIATINSPDRQRFYFGGANGRIAYSFVGSNADTTAAGLEQSVEMSISTGLIFPVADPSIDVAYKKLTVMLKARGSYNLTLGFKIDNFATQSLTLNNITSGDLLGTSFILGNSILGISRVSAAYTQQVDGYGRGFKITIRQTGASSDLAILGYQVFYEPSDYSQETRESDTL